jgi:lipopolysaccharide export system permease protein
MRILHRYIGLSFLMTVAAVLAVVTFVMSLLSLFRLTDLLARGAPAHEILLFFALSFPIFLTFSIPVSLLTASLLLFGRLARDHELTAMKACGISLWQAVRMPMLIGALLAAVGLVVNFEIAPRIETRQRDLLAQMRSALALSLLEEGQFIELGPSLSVRIGRRSGDEIQDIIILQSLRDGSLRRIEAHSGRLTLSADGDYAEMDLREVRVMPFLEGGTAGGFVQRWPIRLPIRNTSPPPEEKKPTTMTRDELIAEMTAAPAVSPRRYRLLVEVNKRIVMALAAAVFVLLGIPLAVYNPRKESSVSIGLSLLMAVLFYMAIIIPKTLGDHPEYRPHLLVWLPILVSLMLGTWLMRRLN